MNAQREPACPSRFELGRFESAGASGPLRAHVDACPGCAAAMHELADARQVLFGADADVASAAAARRILDDVAGRRTTRTRFWQRWLPLTLVPAAAAFALFVANGRTHVAAPDAPVVDPGTRVKGPLTMEAVYKRGNDVFAVTDGAALVAGDRLRFAYTKGAAGYMVVFSVDDRGVVSPYYDKDRLSGIPVKAGARVMLPDSIELDAHRGFERVYALWSERPIEAASVDAAIRDALAAAGGDVRKATRLPLNAEQSSFLLARP